MRRAEEVECEDMIGKVTCEDRSEGAECKEGRGEDCEDRAEEMECERLEAEASRRWLTRYPELSVHLHTKTYCRTCLSVYA